MSCIIVLVHNNCLSVPIHYQFCCNTSFCNAAFSQTSKQHAFLHSKFCVVITYLNVSFIRLKRIALLAVLLVPFKLFLFLYKLMINRLHYRYLHVLIEICSKFADTDFTINQVYTTTCFAIVHGFMKYSIYHYTFNTITYLFSELFVVYNIAAGVCKRIF